MSTMNVFSNAGNVMGAVLYCGGGADRYIDLSQGFAYSLMITNNTDEDITSGTVQIEVADAKPDSPCEPDTWGPLDPVNGCGPIVSGQPYVDPVSIEITPERPIRARSSCAYSAPCPKQFMRVTGAPAGTDVVAIVTRPRRSDFSHLGPYGGIPPPISLAAPFRHDTGVQPSAIEQQPQRQTLPPEPQRAVAEEPHRRTR
jgi:hypothetical protein